MVNTIIFLDDLKNAKVIEPIKNQKNSKIYVFNFITSKLLEEKKLNFEIGDNVLNDSLRDEIFNHTVKFHKWYLNQKFSDDFTLFGVNILGMLDQAELHSFLIHKLLRFFAIKKIIECEKPLKIIASTDLKEIITYLKEFYDFDFELLSKIEEEEEFEYDKYSFIINIGSKPFSLSLSRKTYSKIKKSLEKISGIFFNLWYTPNKNEEIVLLLEFNPLAAESLLSSLSKTNKKIVLFNTRRPAAWNFKSLKILKQNNIKLLNPKNFLDKNILNEINRDTTLIKNNFSKLLKNFDDLIDVFSIDNFSAWPLIQNKFITSFQNRLHEYVTLIYLANNFFDNSKVSCLLYLSAVGESETAFLNSDSNSFPSIIIEHGFANYTKDSGKYDALSFYHFLRDKIAVWGPIQRDYLISSGHVNQEQILTLGSFKHDNFFTKKYLSKRKDVRKLLLTLHPINEYAGRGNIQIFQRFEKFVEILSQILKNYSNCELIVKLHPGHSTSDYYVKTLFEKFFDNVKILQITPISNLLEDCDILINISPESYDPSTVLLESMIMEIPIIDISLDDKKYELEYIKDNAVLELSMESNIEYEIKQFFENKQLRDKFIKNGKKHVQKYLSHMGTSSDEFAKIIENF